MNFLGQHRPFARSRAILQFAARATGPQNAGRKTRKITGRNAPLSQPPRAALAVPANRASQNHPPRGEKTRNPSRNSPPPLENLPKNPQNRVSLATRRNSQQRRQASRPDAEYGTIAARVPLALSREPQGVGCVKDSARLRARLSPLFLLLLLCLGLGEKLIEELQIRRMDAGDVFAGGLQGSTVVLLHDLHDMRSVLLPP